MPKSSDDPDPYSRARLSGETARRRARTRRTATSAGSQWHVCVGCVAPASTVRCDHPHHFRVRIHFNLRLPFSFSCVLSSWSLRADPVAARHCPLHAPRGRRYRPRIARLLVAAGLGLRLRVLLLPSALFATPTLKARKMRTAALAVRARLRRARCLTVPPLWPSHHRSGRERRRPLIDYPGLPPPRCCAGRWGCGSARRP